MLYLKRMFNIVSILVYLNNESKGDLNTLLASGYSSIRVKVN
jgi:hypothetical protein